MPEPSTATTVTSVSPIMSAAAVDAVRPGLRTALAPASSPATPPARRAGQPTTRAIGFTRRGASSAMPANRPSTPTPSSSATSPALTPSANIAARIDTSDADSTTDSGLGRMRLELRLRQHRALADRRDRRDAGRAPRRQDAGEQRDAGADDERRRDRVRRDDRAGVGQLDAEGGEQRDHALGDPEAHDEPHHRGEQADHEAFETHRAHDLLARGAERPQRRELPRALGDRDRQGVEDHEAADQQRDAGEAEQHVADHRHPVVEVLRVGLGLRRAVLHLEVRRPGAA